MPFLSCLVLFLSSAPSGRAFFGACRSRPTLYRAEHHTPMGRVLRSCALEPVSGRCAALTHVLPVLGLASLLPNLPTAYKESLYAQCATSKILFFCSFDRFKLFPLRGKTKNFGTRRSTDVLLNYAKDSRLFGHFPRHNGPAEERRMPRLLCAWAAMRGAVSTKSGIF